MDTMSTAPRAILITGANRGLGLEFVRQIVRFSTPPKYLFATCRNPESATSLQEMARSHSCIKVLKLDVCDFNSYRKLEETVSCELQGEGLNLIVCNAGVFERSGFEDTTPELMMSLFTTHTIAPMTLAQTFAPHMKSAAQKSSEEGMSWRKATVVNITSELGSIAMNKCGGFYPCRASRTALNMVTKTQSIDLKTDGILVVAINPGWVQTNMGGPSAPVTPIDSVKGMLSVVSNLSAESSGKMFNFKGEIMPW